VPNFFLLKMAEKEQNFMEHRHNQWRSQLQIFQTSIIREHHVKRTEINGLTERRGTRYALLLIKRERANEKARKRRETLIDKYH